MFFSFLAVHFAHMKIPAQGRGIASTDAKIQSWHDLTPMSQTQTVRPWYDASFKL